MSHFLESHTQHLTLFLVLAFVLGPLSGLALLGEHPVYSSAAKPLVNQENTDNMSKVDTGRQSSNINRQEFSTNQSSGDGTSESHK